MDTYISTLSQVGKTTKPLLRVEAHTCEEVVEQLYSSQNLLDNVSLDYMNHLHAAGPKPLLLSTLSKFTFSHGRFHRVFQLVLFSILVVVSYQLYE